MLTEKDFEDRNLAENEDVIEKALHYLRLHDPKNANREYAIGLLKFMQRVAKEVAEKSTLSFEEYIDQYNRSQQK